MAQGKRAVVVQLGNVEPELMYLEAEIVTTFQDMRDGKYVYATYNVDNFNGSGFLAGDVDEFRPSFVHHFNDSISHGSGRRTTWCARRR